MANKHTKNISWNYLSLLIIISFGIFQIARWRMLPQFMDIYYHLLTAWGFLRAGGYSGWDFWQYAPFGRVHIYPPIFHLILAGLIKLGFNKIILAKFFEAVTPIIFLAVIWNFARKNYNRRIAFFAVIAFSASFSFYLSLLNHVPATSALIFGFLSLDYLLQKKTLPAVLLLTLCFYTHIGISWFMFFTLFFYGLFDNEYRKIIFPTLGSALFLSLPVLFKQLTGLKFISALGWNMNEKYLCQVKIINYILAFLGLIIAFKQDRKYRLFLGFFCAGLIFLIYPYRFFSAEGYLPVIFLSALTLEAGYERASSRGLIKYAYILAAIFIFIFLSPTLSMNKPTKGQASTYQLNFFDSAFTGMLLAKGKTIWFPEYYLSAVDLVRNNSLKDDIIYSTVNISGLTIAALSERATANALFPEIGPIKKFDPFLNSKIIIFARDDNTNKVRYVVNKYGLVRIGENKLFILYKNPLSPAKVTVRGATVPFWAILSIAVLLILLIKKYLT